MTRPARSPGAFLLASGVPDAVALSIMGHSAVAMLRRYQGVCFSQAERGRPPRRDPRRVAKRGTPVPREPDPTKPVPQPRTEAPVIENLCSGSRPGWTVCELPASTLGAPESIGGLGAGRLAG